MQLSFKAGGKLAFGVYMKLPINLKFLGMLGVGGRLKKGKEQILQKIKPEVFSPCIILKMSLWLEKIQ